VYLETMATTSKPTSTVPSSTSLSTTEIPQEPESPLPGIKRGIAIGVACSVSLILILILAFFAIRRRNRILSHVRQAETTAANKLEVEAWPQEKAWWTATPPSPPPVEADARTIYELDATQITELPSNTNAQVTERIRGGNNISENENDLYAQKLEQWKAWSIALEPDPTRATSKDSHCRLPLLTVSPPEAARGDVSPLLNSPCDVPSRSASPVSVLSPPPSTHFPSGRHDRLQN
jgi:hypothetical protein